MTNKFFEIEIFGKAVKLTNHSKFKLIMSKVPIRPKMKYKDLRIIQPKSFVIFDFDYDFDITQVSFRFDHV